MESNSLWKNTFSENGILLPKLFWPTVRINCSSDREKKIKIRGWRPRIFKKNSEQFWQQNTNVCTYFPSNFSNWVNAFKAINFLVPNPTLNVWVLIWKLIYSANRLGTKSANTFKVNENFRGRNGWWAIPFKVHIFWEGHKILRNLHLSFDWHYIRRTKVR